MGGHLSHELQKPINEVVKSGASLAFVSYPEVISKFEVLPQLFAVLFFLMLITLGFGSATGLISNMITVVCDGLPSLPFLSGLLYLTPGGQALLGLVDYYGGSLLVPVLALVEIMAIAWVYDVNNVLADLSMMLNIRLGVYWKVCWTVIIPECLIFILLFILYDYTPVEYNGSPLPGSYQTAGWMIALTGLAFLPIFLSVEVWKHRRDVRRAFQPSSKWGPHLTQDWRDWRNSRRQGNTQERVLLQAFNRQDTPQIE